MENQFSSEMKNKILNLYFETYGQILKPFDKGYFTKQNLAIFCPGLAINFVNF